MQSKLCRAFLARWKGLEQLTRRRFSGMMMKKPEKGVDSGKLNDGKDGKDE